MSDLKDGKLYLLLFLSTILLFLSFWAGVHAFPPYEINVGDESDEGYVPGFHGRERSQWSSYRWSKARSAIIVPDAGNVPLDMKVTMDGGRPEDLPAPDVRLFAHGEQLAAFIVKNGLKSYEFRHTPRTPSVARDLVVQIRADAFVPSAGDTRRLGVMVTSLEATPIAGQWWYANWGSIIGLSAAISISFLAMRSVGCTAWGSFFGALLLLASLCLGMVISVEEVTRFSVLLLAVCALCLAAVRVFHASSWIQQARLNTQYLLLFALVGLIALSFLHSPGATDVSAWMRWVHNVDTHGIVSGYAANEEMYPPLSSVVLLIVAKASRLFRVDAFVGLKLSLGAFLLLTTIVFLKWTGSLPLAAMLMSALILNSMALGYIDVYFAPLLILSLWALQARKLLLFTVLFSASCLTKWQPMIIAPFALVYILDIKSLGHWKEIDFGSLIRLVLVPVLLVLAVVLSVFGFEPIRAFGLALVEDDLSGTALNFNWVLTYVLHTFYPSTFGGLEDGQATVILTHDPRVVVIPKLVFFILYAWMLVAQWRREKSFENLIFYSLMGCLAYFMFNTGVHENHLFLATILAAVLACIDRKYLPAFVIWSLVANMNLVVFYGIDGKGLPFSRVVGLDVSVLLSVLTLLLFVVFFAVAVREKHAASPQAR